uniref:CAMK/CAMKL/KIN4 protein kinase n=1 Tax=Ganoderma boninense TaxID=34458 RepID=A0A5K1K6E3_9APHY|nr:CAMK/CAMKL/KIN4 protein kinase [Ganoderma boninense]
MDPDLEEELHQWRSKPLQEHDLPFEDAVDSLYTSEPVIELRQKTPSRWNVCRAGTDEPAVFSYAMLFAHSDDYFTGNLGEPLARGERASVDDSGGDRVFVFIHCMLADLDTNHLPLSEHYASFKCNYAYAFDTFHDKSIWSIMEKLEDYTTGLAGFNPADHPRRGYDAPTEAGLARRFWMRAPMFVRRNRGKCKPAPPSHIHPRVANADRRSSMYNASPARPVVYMYDEETAVFTEVTESDVLLAGDIVMVAFTLYFIIGKAQWFPVIIPGEIVRVSPEPVDAPVEPDDDLYVQISRRRIGSGAETMTVRSTSLEATGNVCPRGDASSTVVQPLPDGHPRPGRSHSTESVSGIALSVAAMEVAEPEPHGPSNPPVSDDDMDDFVFPDPPGTSGSPSLSSSFVHPGDLRDPPPTDSDNSQSSAGPPSARGPGRKRKRDDGEPPRRHTAGDGLGSDEEDGADIAARHTRKSAAKTRR